MEPNGKKTRKSQTLKTSKDVEKSKLESLLTENNIMMAILLGKIDLLIEKVSKDKSLTSESLFPHK